MLSSLSRQVNIRAGGRLLRRIRIVSTTNRRLRLLGKGRIHVEASVHSRAIACCARYFEGSGFRVDAKGGSAEESLGPVCVCMGCVDNVLMSQRQGGDATAEAETRSRRDGQAPPDKKLGRKHYGPRVPGISPVPSITSKARRPLVEMSAMKGRQGARQLQVESCRRVSPGTNNP